MAADAENQGWFMGLAPADHSKIAIAASVECAEQFGNDIAASIFRNVAEAILAGESASRRAASASTETGIGPSNFRQTGCSES